MEEIIEKLKIMNLVKVAELSGVPYHRLWRIANGRAKKPSYDDCTKLIEFFKDK